MRAPQAGPALVGRHDDLQVLVGALADAGRGVPRAVAVGGEAGMGKTRLLREFRATVASDVVVLSTECVDLGPLGVPFGPVRTLLRQLVAAVGADAVLAAAGAGRPALLAVLPELQRQGDDPAVGVEPLHETVLALLGEFSREAPIVVIVDDAQWADAATLALLNYLVKLASGEHLLMVIAYRSDEAGRAVPLRQLLAELDRARAISRVELGPLSDPEIAELVTRLRGAEPNHAMFREIALRSEGVPFYIEELVGLAHDDIPDTLRDLLLARYERLDERARKFLRLLSVGGMRVPHAAVRRVLEDVPFDREARMAADEGMISVEADGYAFRHSLVREAVYAELLPGERQEAHERFALALDGARDAASELSYHWLAARDFSRALQWSAIAFDQAVAAHAYASALELGDRALGIWEKVPDAVDQAGRSRDTLLTQLTFAARDAGDRYRGLAIADQALAALDANDAVGRARILQVRSGWLADEGLPGAEDAIEEALRGLGDSEEDLELTALLQAQLSGRHSLVGRIELSRTMRDTALETAKRAGSHEVISRLLLDWGWDEVTAGDIERGRELFAESLEHGPDGDALLRWGGNTSDAYNLVGHYAETLEVTRYPIERARELGLERSCGGALSNTVDALFALGRWDEADERGAQLLVIQPSGCTVSNQHLRRVMMSNWRDDTPRATAIARDHGALIQTFAEHGDLQDILPTAFALGELALFEGDLSEAWRNAERAWSPPHEGATGYDLPLLGLAARVVGELRRRGESLPEDAVARIEATFDTLAPLSTVPRWRSFVDAELTGDGSDVAAWQSAVEHLGDESMPAHLLAYSWWRLGQAQLASGDRPAARTSLKNAVEQADRIGAHWVKNRSEELLATAGLTEKVRQPESALTARERQVLDLIVAGLSNKEIAERLYISTKTASIHVSAILRKLGATSRTQAVALSSRPL